MTHIWSKSRVPRFDIIYYKSDTPASHRNLNQAPSQNGDSGSFLRSFPSCVSGPFGFCSFVSGPSFGLQLKAESDSIIPRPRGSDTFRHRPSVRQPSAG